MGGKSSASWPLTRASKRAHLISMPAWSSPETMSTRSGGRELTKSVSSLAGMVTVPSPSTCAPIQTLTAISRSVAASFRRELSVASRTFCVMGSVVRVATARWTTERPRFRFSCRQDSCMVNTP